MNVHSEGVRLPAAHFHDGFGVSSSQMESHGTSSAQGVAADIRGFVAEFVEANRICCCPNGVVDVVWCHKTRLEEELVLDPVNWALL